MRSESRQNDIRVDEENPYWISFSDLMSALLVVFILAAVALIIELTETQKRIEEDIQQLRNAEQARRDIIHEIRDELANQNITVIVADNDTVLRIPETTLTFDSNSYTIPDDEKLRQTIEQIGLILHATINKPFDKSKNGLMRFEYLDTVFLEGHTDSQASSRVKGNWGLSSFRAISLWEFWEDRLAVSPSLSEMENAFGQKLFSVSGYAATRLVQLAEETPEQRTANRRIDIRFTVKRPTISQLEDIIEK
ncbi:OmpA/MotB family protein [Desulfofustis glycolicus]|uniref:Flagellar motor protein MotB n=1 Tax=Desulfofustis glycolicus DSM 9705 TaxID=1121409 RepID=A0A1M5XPT4_9BACT|nr:OmpA family protein [Desulfofustis glycolicus]SHI01810.1 Flagellar motor protein MotB [Desulfofustis glycolicus DSM 9705]